MLSIAFGPRRPQFGSWNWIGEDLARALSETFQVQIFDDNVPTCDVVVFVKFKPPLPILRELARRAGIVYCPVDIYGSSAEIDADWQSLNLCDLVVVHSRTLLKYVSSYARTEYLDHHLKFIATPPAAQPASGPILWTGNAANLPPLVQWVNEHGLPAELVILTDIEDASEPHRTLGFQAERQVLVHRWTPENHHWWAARSRLAIDIKGDDFRARHKPPAKAYDYLASGLPLAMNLDSCTAESLRSQGFPLVDPRDGEAWQSKSYWQQTQVFAAQLRAHLTLDAVSQHFATLLLSLDE